ncbi:uncharacterized protein Ecym_3054 [Eremothecium cymbalariae DBVPG|uniref:Uncharacterized protein n=1 Tax=Eremothecium cymbalariae (strain CBS 270.75 / DBVPG 7215 / KCTC 17166 / NRRL Y-17582) TaxID=931890 RepID=G8JQZ7_ERECY|nr:Hypothetical protein Ecym_3054 [Eremothecium cymbalariae DBVPG\
MFEKDQLLPLDESKVLLIKNFFASSHALIADCLEKQEFDSVPKAVSVLNIQLGFTEIEEVLDDQISIFKEDKKKLEGVLVAYEPFMISALLKSANQLRKKYQDPESQSIDPKSQDFDLINLLNMQSLIMMRRSRKLYEDIIAAYNKLIAVIISLDEFKAIVTRYLDSLILLRNINLEIEYFVSYCKDFENITIFVKEFGTGLDSINEKTQVANRFLTRAEAYQRKIQRVCLDSLIEKMKKKCDAITN